MVVQVASNPGLANASEAIEMFHDYVIQNFGEKEQDLVIVAGQFSKDIGCKLNVFLGGSYKVYSQQPEFVKWFESRKAQQSVNGFEVSPKVMIKARQGKSTQIPSADICSAIRAKVPFEPQHPGIPKLRPPAPVVPTVSRLELGEGLHFFGLFYPTVRKEKDFFGNDRNYSEVRFVQVERETEQRRVNLEIDPAFSEYAVKGEFVVGDCSNGQPRLLDRSHRAIIFRSWSDFEESEKYSSLQLFLDSDQELQLTPRFKTKYNEIVIFDECRFYTGFRMDMMSRIMKADEVRVSSERYSDIAAVRSVVYLFENRADFRYGYGFAADKFMIGCPFRSRWQTTDAFFTDQSFWQIVGSRVVIGLEEVLKVCGELLLDGKWHDKAVLINELNERIPGLSASGVPDEDIRDGLRDFSNVELIADVQGNWSVRIKQATGGEDSVLSVKDKEWATTDFSSCSASEADFLARFFNFVRDCGFEYTPRDLVRFHTCVKCGFFTLLGGAPGTGKSSLSLLYSKAIAGSTYKDRNTSLRVDVNPGWMEPEDLLGYYSVSAGGFKESTTGLVSFLRAAKDTEEMRTVCFEEMNLAHVEQYFSDFIQQMSRQDGDRHIYVEKAGCTEKIALERNLRFVGTVNFDETTHELSARFYDRCNYIELTQQDIANLLNCESSIHEDVLETGCHGGAISRSAFESWKTKGNPKTVDGRGVEIINIQY